MTDSLETLAGDLKARIGLQEHFDADIGEWTHRQIKLRLRGYRITIYASPSRAVMDVAGFSGGEGAFSVNAISRVSLFKNPVAPTATGLSHPVFVGPGGPDSAVSWLSVPSHPALVERLGLTATESIHFFTNGIKLVGDPRRLTRETVESLCDIADVRRAPAGGGTVDGLPFDPSGLPAPLRSLEPVIRRFAVGDDAEREEILGKASPRAIADLRDSVLPRMPEINAFLSSFGDRTLTWEAVLIGRLAEAVSEIIARDA